MSTIIQNILQNAIGDGARGTKVDALFSFTNTNQPEASKVSASVKTASFPGKTHTENAIKLKGRPIPIRGAVKYSQQWECTFYLSENHYLKKEFEMWIEGLDEVHNYVESRVVTGLNNIQSSHRENGHYRDIEIHQLSFDETDIMSKYIIHNAFPYSVSSVNTSHEGGSKVLEFTVGFRYTHYTHEIIKGQSGNFLDSIIDKITIPTLNELLYQENSDSVESSSGNVYEKSNQSTFDKLSEKLNTGGISSSNMPSKLGGDK